MSLLESLSLSRFSEGRSRYECSWALQLVAFALEEKRVAQGEIGIRGQRPRLPAAGQRAGVGPAPSNLATMPTV